MDARRACVPMLVCVLASGLLLASETRASERDRALDGYCFVSSYYDNNVFSYSDQDRDRFAAGDTTSGRYPIEDLFDYVTTLAARGDYRWNIHDQSMWRARLLYDGTFYALNTDRTSHRFGASLERQLPRANVTLSGNYTPDYYLRHLYWRPMPGRPAGVRYAAAQYDKFVVGVDGDIRLSHTVNGLMTMGFARRNYDYPFDERDNDTYSFGAGVDVAAHPRLDLSLLLSADLSNASGADSTSPVVADISNNRYGFKVTGSWRMSRWLRFVQSFDYGHQVYTSDKVADISHFDRRDDEIETTSELRVINLGGWQPQAYFQYRASTSTVPPGIAEFGQYTAFRFGLQVTYYF